MLEVLEDDKILNFNNMCLANVYFIFTFKNLTHNIDSTFSIFTSPHSITTKKIDEIIQLDFFVNLRVYQLENSFL